MEAIAKMNPSEANAAGMREYQEYLASQRPEDLAFEQATHMPVEFIRPIEVESRHEAGLIIAGVICAITIEMPVIAGVFLRIYGVEEIPEAIEGLKNPESTGNAMSDMQEMARAISVGVRAYTPKEFGQLVAYFIDDEDRTLLIASLASAQRQPTP